MRPPWLVLILLLLCSCVPTAQAEAPLRPGDLALAKVFFGRMNEKPFVLTSDPKKLNESERAALAWLNQGIPAAGENKPGHFSYLLHAGKPGDADAYALRRHAAQDFAPLDPTKTYVQVRYRPDGLACPEFHGVIDPDGPTLLSFWGEGG
jgi:hypothetical protein